MSMSSSSSISPLDHCLVRSLSAFSNRSLIYQKKPSINKFQNGKVYYFAITMHLCLLILGNKGRVLYFFFAIVILHRKKFCVQNLAIYTTFTYFSKSPCILQWLEFWRPNIQNCKSPCGCHWFITSHCWKVTCGRNNYYASDCLNRHSRNSFESTLFRKFRQTTLHCTLYFTWKWVPYWWWVAA